MDPSRWEDWLKFPKCFDLWGQIYDRIPEHGGLVAVRRHGECCVPGPGSALGATRLLGSPLPRGLTDEQSELRLWCCPSPGAQAGAGTAKPGLFPSGCLLPFVFLWVVGLVERLKANF